MLRHTKAEYTAHHAATETAVHGTLHAPQGLGALRDQYCIFLVHTSECREKLFMVASFLLEGLSPDDLAVNAVVYLFEFLVDLFRKCAFAHMPVRYPCMLSL